MESWFYWVFLLVLFRNTGADSATPHYTIQNSRVSFTRAAEDCSPGVLTTLATQQEVADILKLVSEWASPRHQNEFIFWIGLRKVKNQCVVPALPLRGFKWTDDSSKDSQVIPWAEEPKHTCTTVLCAALKGDFNGSAVTRWGLTSVTCKNSYQFICKLRDRETSAKPAAPEPAAPEPAAPEPAAPETAAPEPAAPEPAAPEPAAPEPSAPEPAAPEPAAPEPATPEPAAPEPAAPEPSASEPATPANPEPSPVTQKTEPAEPEPKLPSQRPKPETDHKPKAGPDPGSEPAFGSDLCQRPHIPSARSINLDRNNSSRIQVQCWVADRLELHCSGRPAMWRLLDNSPANFTTICLPCEDGFQKDANGDCVDIDECSSGGACRHSCLNTEGSFSCFCLDEAGMRHNDNSSVCAGAAANSVLIPLLVSVATLVVLVVVVTVMVKCCLMRRSKKRAMKKAENMAMKSKDSKDPTV